MLVSVDLDAFGAERQQALLVGAEIGDLLVGVEGAGRVDRVLAEAVIAHGSWMEGKLPTRLAAPLLAVCLLLRMLRSSSRRCDSLPVSYLFE